MSTIENKNQKRSAEFATQNFVAFARMVKSLLTGRDYLHANS